MFVARRFFRTTTPRLARSVNSVTLVGVVHDIQSGFVYEDAVTQFTLTTTSIDTASAAQECVVEKDHHTVRCFGDQFAHDVRGRIKEGNVLCVAGRLRLNPQLEPGCNKHFYFPYVHVDAANGGISVVHGDRRKPPAMSTATAPVAGGDGGETADAAAAVATGAAATEPGAEPGAEEGATPAAAAAASAEPAKGV